MDTNSYAFVWLLSTIAEGIAGYIIAKIIGKRYMTVINYFRFKLVLLYRFSSENSKFGFCLLHFMGNER
jgi:hypothetical protein